MAGTLSAAVGASLERVEAREKVTGQARYAVEHPVEGVVHAAIAQASVAAGEITGIDSSAALARPGVLAVVTRENALELAEVADGELAVLQSPRVAYRGQIVAAVVAESLEAAREAAALLDFTYDARAHDVELQADHPRLYRPEKVNPTYPADTAQGDFDGAFAAAAVTVDETYETPAFHNNPMEPHASIARWEGGDLVVHDSTQGPAPARQTLAEVFGLPPERVRVIAPHVGGGFGLKMHGHPEEPLVCHLSRRLGVPVKWIEDRRETLLIGAREHFHRWAVAFKDDGTITGFKDHFTANVGAISASPGWGMAFLTGLSFPTGYKIPNTDVVVTIATTNKAPWNATRGYGKEGTNLVMERAVDLVSQRLGIEPAEVRKRNYVGVDEFPYRTNSGLNIDSGDYHSLTDKALALLGYASFRAEQERARAEGRHVGFGLAFELTPEAADIPGTLVGGYDTSTVKMDPSGKVTILTGVTSPGSGNDTGIAQIVADELGVDIDDIAVIQGDTGICPYGFGNYSGRSMVVGGNSALLAARDIREKLAIVAGTMLEADPAELSFGDGRISAGERSASVAEVSYTIYTLAFATAHNVEPPLESTRTYKPQNITHFPDDKGRIQPYPTYSNAVHVAVVEVDVETGKVVLTRFGVAHDCGVMINPRFIEGQMHGAIVMGVGAALSEHQVYDDQGQLQSNRFKTYLMPRASDVPHIEMEHQVTPSPFTLLGVKGAGEAGVGGAQAAILNAINDAILPLGARLRRTPATAPNVLAAIREADGR
jgi:aerobic carbon-monoxide dehydrogenase large subunit